MVRRGGQEADASGTDRTLRREGRQVSRRWSSQAVRRENKIEKARIKWREREREKAGRIGWSQPSR